MYVFLFCVFLYLPSYFLCRLQTNSRVRKNCKPFSGTAHFRDKLKLRIYEYIHVFSDYQGGVWILRYKCNDQAHVQTRKLLNKCRLCFSFLEGGKPWAQNLRQGIVMKTSFKTRVSRMGLGSFVNINLFL